MSGLALFLLCLYAVLHDVPNIDLQYDAYRAHQNILPTFHNKIDKNMIIITNPLDIMRLPFSRIDLSI